MLPTVRCRVAKGASRHPMDSGEEEVWIVCLSGRHQDRVRVVHCIRLSFCILPRTPKEAQRHRSVVLPHRPRFDSVPAVARRGLRNGQGKGSEILGVGDVVERIITNISFPANAPAQGPPRAGHNHLVGTLNPVSPDRHTHHFQPVDRVCFCVCFYPRKPPQISFSMLHAQSKKLGISPS